MWRIGGSNPWPSACKADALASWANSPGLLFVLSFNRTGKERIRTSNSYYKLTSLCVHKHSFSFFLKRRWSSRTFQYDYLVTTSPPSRNVPSTAFSLRLNYRLRVPPTRMVWRAVCTRPGNVFTAPCWCAITSDSNFMESSFRLQSELRLVLCVLLHLTASLHSVPTIVARV